MRAYINYFLAFLATASGFYLSWRFTQPELNGHWHITASDSTWRNPGISTLDIHLNGTVVVDEFESKQNGITGKINRFSRHIYLGPSCLSLELDLNWQDDTLVFEETPWKRSDSPPDQFKAVKVPAGECTYESDFYLRVGHKFILPEILRKQPGILYNPQSMDLFVTPGPKKPRIQGYYGRDIAWENLAGEVNNLDTKMPTYKRPVPINIFADDGIPKEQIEYILAFFKKLTFRAFEN